MFFLVGCTHTGLLLSLCFWVLLRTPSSQSRSEMHYFIQNCFFERALIQYMQSSKLPETRILKCIRVMHTHPHTQKYVCVYTYTLLCMCTYTHTSYMSILCIYTRTQKYMCVYIYTSIHTCIHRHIFYTCLYVCIHTHTYVTTTL